MSDKTLRRLHAALRDDIGDLVTRRPLPGPGLDQVDPFLFLNHHGPQLYRPGNGGLPFGPHPHRGFETVTFILAGELAHHDSGGHESVIAAGGVQWMTAGRGLIHAEVSPAAFKRDGGPLEILQLWVNLPARLKMTEPRYVGLQRDAVPEIEVGQGEHHADGGAVGAVGAVGADGVVGRLGGAESHAPIGLASGAALVGQASDGALVHQASADAALDLIAGRWGEQRGPIESLTGVFMSTVRMRAGATVHADGLSGRSVLFYVVRGSVRVDGQTAAPFTLAEFDSGGDALRWTAQTDAVVLFGHADPIGEPVVAHGPFVMNTRQEIAEAIRDYQAGRFGSPQALAGV